MTTIDLSSAEPTRLEVDAIVVGVTGADDGIRLLGGAEAVDAALGGSLAATLRQLGAAGKADEVTKVPTGGAAKAGVVVAVGIGKLPDADAERHH
ncbi:MAG: M17 family peptidase N-terminal domain-containing protein, partial [Jiangellaceae bacterium]